MAESSYLKKKRDRYYYQRRVPKDVRGHDLFLKLPEVIERSLHTSDPAEARLRAAEENLAFERRLAEARGHTPRSQEFASSARTSKKPDLPPLPISPDWIEWVASEHYFSLTSPISSAYEYAGFEHEDSEERLQDTEGFELASLMAKEDDLKKRKIRAVRRAALSYLRSENRLTSPLERDKLKRIKPHPVEGEQGYRDLCQALIDAELDAIKFVKVLYDEGKVSKELNSHHFKVIKKPATSKPLNLNEVAKNYLATSPNVTEEWAQRVNRIVEVCSSLGMPTDVTKIKKADVRGVFDKLKHAPRNWSQKFPGKTIAEAIELGKKEGAKTLSPNTIRDGYLAALKAVLSFAEERELIDSNPTRNLKIEKARNDGRGTGFEPNELSKLFRLPLFCGCQDHHHPLIPGDYLVRDHRFWAPLIALFTGARTAEIAQKSSDDWNAVFIELEKPQSRFFQNGSNKFHSDFVQALQQINQWKAWFLDDGNQQGFLTGTINAIRVPAVMTRNPTYNKYVLVFGRRNEYAGNDQRRKLIKAQETDDFKIITYDSLVEGLGQKQGLFTAARHNDHIRILSNELVEKEIFAWVDPSLLSVNSVLYTAILAAVPSNIHLTKNGEWIEALGHIAPHLRRH